jgi:hypothetical protein
MTAPRALFASHVCFPQLSASSSANVGDRRFRRVALCMLAVSLLILAAVPAQAQNTPEDTG